jgi:dihydrolipoamide dehydrogenase
MASFDVIFLGGGPAGYVGAIRCAQLGLSTAVVEREGLGGTCVLWGCIPAKALLEAAAYAEKMKKAPEFGVTPGEVKLDFGVAMKRSRAVSTQNSKGVEFLFKKNKVTWIKGTGKLTGRNTVSVKTAEGKEEKHDAKKAVVISTGSRVKGLGQIGLELNKKTVISSDEALIVEKAPKSITIVGAGAVGCEFADVFAAFGSQVTLVEVMPNILPVEDADSSKEVERAFKKRKIDVLTGAKISNVKVGKDSISMSIEAGGAKKDVKCDMVLVAAGRAPNIEDIGLKEQGVQLTDRGFIKINEKMETSVKGIFAIGDVAGPRCSRTRANGKATSSRRSSPASTRTRWTTPTCLVRRTATPRSPRWGSPSRRAGKRRSSTRSENLLSPRTDARARPARQKAS